jgi:hypothetical protein
MKDPCKLFKSSPSSFVFSSMGGVFNVTPL